MGSVTIAVEVEESFFVPVARALSGTQGVLKVNFDLALGTGKGLKGTRSRAPGEKQERQENGASPAGVKRAPLRELLAGIMFKQDDRVPLRALVDLAVAAGFKPGSVTQILYDMREAGIVDRVDPSMYGLTKAARKRLANAEAHPDPAVPQLPAPKQRARQDKSSTKHKTGNPAMPVFLAAMAKQGSPATKEMITLFMEGYSDKTVERTIFKAAENGLIKEISPDHVELTPKGRKLAEQNAEPKE
jgi:Mn-dependent DtxR family transcriptional regulator